ncbi:hypothetical protein [Streptomyces lanatus]|uniref:Uncharacterized protein n=1 Tax=Streptomyces lanatus TaxID=66900 RepID=A0ABV1XHM4_9ACTN|nr:hypothetical protein [Streptomyces lanatus]GHG94331.1 hypothetical protein GCM10018780_17500 [Streptomyces lanatus]
MSDYVHGDKVTGTQYKQVGDHNVQYNGEGLSRAELDAAVEELRSFIADLRSAGMVSPDGTVVDPGAVVAAVQSQPGRLRALGRAVSAGAKDAVLTAVQGGVAALVAGLVAQG